MVKSAIGQAALAAPYHYDHLMELDKALDGENPQFNKDVKKLTQDVKNAAPDWVKNAGRTIANWDHQLVQIDQMMQEKYRTIPGIVHEGVLGTVELGQLLLLFH